MARTYTTEATVSQKSTHQIARNTQRLLAKASTIRTRHLLARSKTRDVSPENDDNLNWSRLAASAVPCERSGSIKRSKFSEEQIAYAIRQSESGTPISDLCRQLGVSEATFYTWKKKYAHLGVSELRL